jgi:hypothetical protein
VTVELTRPISVTIFDQSNGSTITEPFVALNLVQRWIGETAYVLFGLNGTRTWLVTGDVDVNLRPGLEAEIREHGVVQDMMDEFVFTARY